MKCTHHITFSFSSHIQKNNFFLALFSYFSGKNQWSNQNCSRKNCLLVFEHVWPRHHETLTTRPVGPRSRPTLRNDRFTSVAVHSILRAFELEQMARVIPTEEHRSREVIFARNRPHCYSYYWRRYKDVISPLVATDDSFMNHIVVTRKCSYNSIKLWWCHCVYTETTSLSLYHNCWYYAITNKITSKIIPEVHKWDGFHKVRYFIY